MKSTDLRRGNLVNRKYWNPNPTEPGWAYEPCTIDVIKMQSVNVLTDKRKECLARLPYDLISGIPLSEEWLLKSGFVKCTRYEGTTRFNIGTNEHNSDHLITINYGIESGNYWFIYSSYKIQHVHEIQNLVFAVSGVELFNIKAS